MLLLDGELSVRRRWYAGEDQWNGWVFGWARTGEGNLPRACDCV